MFKKSPLLVAILLATSAAYANVPNETTNQEVTLTSGETWTLSGDSSATHLTLESGGKVNVGTNSLTFNDLTLSGTAATDQAIVQGTGSVRINATDGVALIAEQLVGTGRKARVGDKNAPLNTLSITSSADSAIKWARDNSARYVELHLAARTLAIETTAADAAAIDLSSATAFMDPTERLVHNDVENEHETFKIKGKANDGSVTTITAPEVAIKAKNEFLTIQTDNNTITGQVKLDHSCFTMLGGNNEAEDTHTGPVDIFKLEDINTALGSAIATRSTLTGKSGPALSLANGSAVLLAAKTLTINSDGDTIVSATGTESKNTLVLYGQDALNLTGDINLADSKTDLAIFAKTAGTITSNVNLTRIANDTRKVKLGFLGNNTAFNGAIVLTGEGTTTPDSEILLGNGATWTLAANSDVKTLSVQNDATVHVADKTLNLQKLAISGTPAVSGLRLDGTGTVKIAAKEGVAIDLQLQEPRLGVLTVGDRKAPLTTLEVSSANDAAINITHDNNAQYAEMRLAAKTVRISTEAADKAALVIASTTPPSLDPSERLIHNEQDIPHESLRIENTSGSATFITAPKVAIDVKNDYLQLKSDNTTITGQVKLDHAYLDISGEEHLKAGNTDNDDDGVAIDIFSLDAIEASPKTTVGNSASINGKAGPALSLANGSAVALLAHTVTLASDGDTAIDMTGTDKNVLVIYAKDALNITGDINVGTSASDLSLLSPKAGTIKSNINVTLAENDTRKLVFDLRGSTKLVGAVNIAKAAAESAASSESSTANKRVRRALAEPTAEQPQGSVSFTLQGASWDLTGDSSLPTLTSKGAKISLNSNALQLGELQSEGQTQFSTTSLEENQLSIDKSTGSGTASLAINLNESTGESDEALQAKVNKVARVKAGNTLKISVEDAVNEHSYDKLSDEEATTKGVDIIETNKKASDVVVAASEISNQQVLAWRTQINDVNKRLGDLRTYEGSNQGGWVRLYGAKQKMKDDNLSSKSNTVQVGFDTKVANNFYVGVTGTYTDGDSKATMGKSDDKAYSFGVYGGWMADNGQFVDVIVKQSHVASDFDLFYRDGTLSTGEFGAWGTSISAEYGWRLNLPGSQRFWVEPQAELSYGHLGSDTYTTSAGVKTQQDSINSVIGRLGVAFGATFEKGSAYVKASVAHDWDSKTSVKVTKGESTSLIEDDLGGTWGEFAFGGTLNFSKNLAGYAEFQTAVGSPVKTPYQWNLGMRYKF